MKAVQRLKRQVEVHTTSYKLSNSLTH